MSKSKKPSLAQRLPHAVLGLCWAMAAQYWRTGAGGTTHAGLKKMLGTDSSATIRRVVADAKSAQVVTVKYTERNRPLVMLRASTVRQLEALWLEA